MMWLPKLELDAAFTWQSVDEITDTLSLALFGRTVVLSDPDRIYTYDAWTKSRESISELRSVTWKFMILGYVLNYYYLLTYLLTCRI